MSEFRRRLMMVGSGGEPPIPYPLVRYIECNGSQYINTGVTFNGVEDWEMGLDILPTEFYNYNALLCIGTGSNNEAWIAGNGIMNFRYNNYKSNNKTLVLGKRIKIRVTYSKPAMNLYFDDVLFQTFNVNPTTITDPLWLFRRVNYAKLLIYGFELYQNGAKVLDYVPVTYNNAGYMYDTVSRQLVGSTSETPFLYSDDITRYDEYGYVDNGKYFHLDGIDDGGIEGVWEDIVGGIQFTPNGSVSKLSNGWLFPGENTSYLTANITNQIINSFITTVEVCIRPTDANNSFVFATNVGAFSPIFVIRTSEGSFRAINSSTQGLGQEWYYNYVSGGNFTISINKDMAISNGNMLSIHSDTVPSWTIDSGIMSIGTRRRSSAWDNSFKGTIHSIRIYNRLLTEAEILNNQRIDNQRFNLGLTI